jgi:hypothetical protein
MIREEKNSKETKVNLKTLKLLGLFIKKNSDVRNHERNR